MLIRPTPLAMRSGAQVGTAIALSVLAGTLIAATGDVVLLSGLLAGSVLVALGLLRPALFLTVLLLMRPVVDTLGANRFSDATSANPGGLLGLVLIAVMLIVLVTARRVVPPRSAFAFAALLVTSALAGLMAPLNIESFGLASLNEFIRLAALAAIFILASHMITDPRRLQGIFVVVGLSAVLPALVGIYELIQGPVAVAGYDIARINGTFVGPVPFSSFLALAALVLTSLPRAALAGWVRWPALSLILVALVATYSREGWILFLVGIALLHWRRRPQLVLGIVMVCVIVVAAVPHVQQRVLPGAETTDGRAAIDSLDWRFDNWRGLLDVYQERPFTGWGLKTTAYINPRAPLAESPDGQISNPGGGYEAHNTGVRALVEGGPLLLMATLGLFASIILSLRRIVGDRRSPASEPARLMLALWVVLLIIGFGTNDPLAATAMMYSVLALTGAVEGTHRRWRGTEAR